jgi:hypothetical protein
LLSAGAVLSARRRTNSVRYHTKRQIAITSGTRPGGREKPARSGLLGSVREPVAKRTVRFRFSRCRPARSNTDRSQDHQPRAYDDALWRLSPPARGKPAARQGGFLREDVASFVHGSFLKGRRFRGEVWQFAECRANRRQNATTAASLCVLAIM